MSEIREKVAPIRSRGPVERVAFVPERGPQRLQRVKRGSTPERKFLSPPALRFADFLAGLETFRRGYTGTFWVEVMLIKGLNDSPDSVRHPADALTKIGPEQIQINVPVRPPAEPWIEAPSQENLERAMEILGTAAHVIPPAAVTVDASGHDDLMGAIIGIVERHPMSEKEPAETLGKWTGSEVAQALHQLDTSGKVQSVIRRGERFWAIPNAHYAETRPAFGTGRGNPKR